MKRSTIAAIATAAVLVVGGGTAYALTTNGQELAPVETTATSEPAATPTETPAEPAPDAAPESPVLPSHITAAGEVCDPQNMNDPICAAFYPDQAVLNITARAADLDSLSDAEKIERAHLACDGGEPADSPLYKAGAIAYCNELAPGIDGQPDRYARLIAFYKALGEDGAKAHYADRVMPTPAELGY